MKELAVPYHKTEEISHVIISSMVSNWQTICQKKVFHSWELLRKIKPSFPETFKQEIFVSVANINAEAIIQTFEQTPAPQLQGKPTLDDGGREDAID